MRTLFIIALAIALSSVPSSLAERSNADTVPDGPARVTYVGTLVGTILAWTPNPDATSHYAIYRGNSPDNLTLIATTHTPHYFDNEARPTAGQTTFYGVSTIVNGTESQPTTLDASPDSACLTVGTNGHVNLRPANCLD